MREVAWDHESGYLVRVLKVVQREGYRDIPAAARIRGQLIVRIGRERWTDEGRGDHGHGWKRQVMEKKIVSVMYKDVFCGAPEGFCTKICKCFG